MHVSSPFPIIDLWEFSANLIVFFLFIYLFFLFLIWNFFIYLFGPYKFLENGSNIFHHYSRSDFLGEKRLIKNIYLFVPYKSLEMEVIFSIIIHVRIFLEKNDLLKIFF